MRADRPKRSVGKNLSFLSTIGSRKEPIFVIGILFFNLHISHFFATFAFEMRLRVFCILFLALMLTACKQAEPEFAFEQREGYRVAEVRIPVANNDSYCAYWLLPDSIPSSGCPAVLLFHDHGAWFTIGKEKLVRPIAADSSLILQSDYWTQKFYAGAYIGDSLAAHGYAVLVTDAVGWDSRSLVLDEDSVDYSTSVADNIIPIASLPFDSIKALNKRIKNSQPEFYAEHMLMTGEPWFETILHNDRASLDWLLSRSEVDPARVGVAGFSLGAYRAWMLSAEDSRPAWCFAANWMTTMEAHGGPLPDVSSWSMYRPMLDSLDYPDIAARAADRPMMILYGSQDPVAPPAAVEEAVARIRAAVPDCPLRTVEQDTPHRFTAESLRLLIAFADENTKD